MDPQPPQSLKLAGIVQIVAGSINLVMGWWLGSCVIGTCCGGLTLGFGGQLCGFAALLLAPLGLVEIGIGIYTLMNPREAAPIQKLVSYVEIGSFFVGGLGSVLAGIGVLVLHHQDQTVAYLEG